MSVEPAIPDLAQRAQALDAAESFIVQAPAGSGKTELLIQRVLRLLAVVEQPEDILAITFTRKAAAEMRQRVLEALASAQGPEPQAAHECQTWALAKDALARNDARRWHLLEHPGRLRMLTIDAWCSLLARQLPWRSGFGATPEVTERAAEHYRDAARAALATYERASESPVGQAAATLLLHGDNRAAVTEDLLAGLLPKRDQWMRHLAGRDPQQLRAELQRDLGQAIRQVLQALRAALPQALVVPLLAMVRGAGQSLVEQGGEGGIALCAALGEALPPAEAEALPLWQALADLLLTGQDTWRKSLTKNQGFPAASSAKGAEKEALQQRKQQAVDLLEELAEEHADLEALFAKLRTLPPPDFPDAQWLAMEALLTLLPEAAAGLRKAFQESGQVDFPALGMAALSALEPDGSPPEGLPRHILVDEFQDTSFSQMRLLERMTADWRAGDGRTLFLVGDPMQSIYAFREAEVGLFLQARSGGIGNLQPRPLRLQANFRSRAGVVDWVNGAFAEVLPQEEDPAVGAVPYAPAAAVHPAGVAPAVQLHAAFENAPEAEAAQVVRLIHKSRARDPEGRVAILFRARGHLRAILPALRAAGLRYRAVEVDALAERPVVQDLMALTRALLHPADRVAWLAILRAPWCGLTLADLLALTEAADRRALWGTLSTLPQREAPLEGLSADGAERARRLVLALTPHLEGRRRGALRRWVEDAWLALGGPACCHNAAGLGEAEAYLDLLEAEARPGEPLDWPALEARVAALYAPPDPEADETLQLLSIHKSKGLAFDTVILPGMGRGPANMDSPLLLWEESPAAEGDQGLLLLAPKAERGADTDPLYAFLRSRKAERESHERGRLLYVAVTRARHQVHLLGHVPLKQGEVNAPRKGSLLDTLWPALETEVLHQWAAAQGMEVGGAAGEAPAAQVEMPLEAAAAAAAGNAAAMVGPPALSRLRVAWQRPPPPPNVSLPLEPERSPRSSSSGPFEAGKSYRARAIGIVLHAQFERIAREGTSEYNVPQISSMKSEIQTQLLARGVVRKESEQAAEHVLNLLRKALEDETGRWILQPHKDAKNEWDITGLLDGQIIRRSLDRTFIDEKGTRWIIDYKTGGIDRIDVNAFIEKEFQTYQSQLETYAKLVANWEPNRPIRVGLYFPALPAWREWTPDASPA